MWLTDTPKDSAISPGLVGLLQWVASNAAVVPVAAAAAAAQNLTIPALQHLAVL